jgi:hypothetical protein
MRRSMLGLALLAMFIIPATAQIPSTYKAPRSPYKDGKPDLNGIWQANNTANWDIQAHSARQGPILELGAVFSIPAGLGVVEGDDIPYQPWAAEKKKENQENWLTRDPEIKCYLPGVPRATYLPHPFQIFQSDKAFFIAYEYAGAVRNVYLKDPGPAPLDSWMGQSFGKWDGDTFVIDVTGFNDQSWFDRSGNFHSEALHVVERYTLIDRDHIQYEATLEDPKVFTRPWKIRMPLYRHVNADARLQQFKCVEFVEELMYGHLRKTPLQ